MALGVGIGERIGDEQESLRRAIECETDKMRVAMPGKIIDFNEEKQTATVQPLIKEQVQGTWVSIPQLLDVPCFFPRAGGYCLTFPVKQDDEVLIIFNDMSIDAWWQSGGEQTQLEARRHDLSDAMALLGITSVPKAVIDYSTDSMRLRNEENNAFFEIMDDKTMNIRCIETITVETQKDLIVTAARNIEVKSTDTMTIHSDAELTVKSAGAMTMQSGTSITMSAPIININ